MYLSAKYVKISMAVEEIIKWTVMQLQKRVWQMIQ